MVFSVLILRLAGLADVLIKNPEIVILDEPTSGVKEFMDLILQLSWEEGHTVLFSSHLLNQVQQVCDRVKLFGNGKLLADIGLTGLEKTERGLDDIYSRYFEGGKEWGRSIQH